MIVSNFRYYCLLSFSQKIYVKQKYYKKKICPLLKFGHNTNASVKLTSVVSAGFISFKNWLSMEGATRQTVFCQKI